MDKGNRDNARIPPNLVNPAFLIIATTDRHICKLVHFWGVRFCWCQLLSAQCEGDINSTWNLEDSSLWMYDHERHLCAPRHSRHSCSAITSWCLDIAALGQAQAAAMPGSTSSRSEARQRGTCKASAMGLRISRSLIRAPSMPCNAFSKWFRNSGSRSNYVMNLVERHTEEESCEIVPNQFNHFNSALAKSGSLWIPALLWRAVCVLRRWRLMSMCVAFKVRILTFEVQTLSENPLLIAILTGSGLLSCFK